MNDLAHAVDAWLWHSEGSAGSIALGAPVNFSTGRLGWPTTAARSTLQNALQ
jgi:hypothetical protein